MPTVLMVERGGVTVAEIEAEWEAVLREAASATAVRDAVSKRDGDPDALANASVEARPYEGDGGVTILITIGTTVATHILMGLWDDHVRPRLRKKYERDAGAARERVTQ